jgi:lysophospholipase L1-like esterase
MQRLFRLILLGFLGSTIATDVVLGADVSYLDRCADKADCSLCKPGISISTATDIQVFGKIPCPKTAWSLLPHANRLLNPASGLVGGEVYVWGLEGGTYKSGQFSAVRPRTNGQLYVQRIATLQAGQLYSHIPPNTFFNRWQTAWQQPTYQQWQLLLQHEAAMMAARQSNRRLMVLVGDSLYLWLPQEYLAGDRLWLNQSISGETTSHLVQRLNYFARVRPDVVYIMAGVNDLKNGVDPDVIVSNMELIVQRLRVQHPQARIVVLSILPTRLPLISGRLVQQVNQQVASAVRRRGVEYMDLQSVFMDNQGLLRVDLTTDGIHLSQQGYDLLTTYLNRL